MKKSKSKTVNDCFIKIKPIADEKKIKLINDINQSTIFYSDVTCFERIVINLCANAIENLSTGGYVRIFDEVINNKIKLTIEDNGNGISKEDLEILLADHIKNSIIAVNCSDNINKSILVRLGLIDNYYSLYVYDSGIEFELDTLSNLGKKPITTHANNGGTGFGFMNTFDTLKKYNASLIINELNPPCSDNYTKSIVIRFDDVYEFKINSYRTVEK